MPTPSPLPTPAPAQAPTPAGPAIIATGVERSFGTDDATKVQALGPLDLEISAGEFVCVVGPSGCGKSTLLRIIAGLIDPTAGEIEIRSHGSGGNPTAMVFQEYSIYPWKRVIDNVRVALDFAGVPKKEATKRARHYLDLLGLGDRLDAYPDTLSGGMKQRVSIARALAVEPEILLMDEPFAALDAQLRQILQEELLSIWQGDQRTVVFITHSLEEAILLGDRVLVMSSRPGRILRSVEVPFPRPRDADVRNDPRFAELREELWSLLRREVETHLSEVQMAEAPTAGPGPGPEPANHDDGGRAS